MKQPGSIFHFLRLLPLSVFTDGRTFFPVIVVFIVVFLGLHWYLLAQGWFHGLELLRYAINMSGFIPLWMVSCCITRIGNNQENLFLQVIPLERWKRTTLLILEHFLMTLLWVIIPFGLVAFVTMRHEFSWNWFLLTPFIGSSIFFLSAIAWKYVAHSIQQQTGEYDLSQFSLSIGMAVVFIIGLPWIDSDFIGQKLLLFCVFIFVLSIILLYLVNLVQIRERTNHCDFSTNEEKEKILLYQ